VVIEQNGAQNTPFGVQIVRKRAFEGDLGGHRIVVRSPYFRLRRQRVQQLSAGDRQCCLSPPAARPPL